MSRHSRMPSRGRSNTRPGSPHPYGSSTPVRFHKWPPFNEETAYVGGDLKSDAATDGGSIHGSKSTFARPATDGGNVEVLGYQGIESYVASEQFKPRPPRIASLSVTGRQSQPAHDNDEIVSFKPGQTHLGAEDDVDTSSSSEVIYQRVPTTSPPRYSTLRRIPARETLRPHSNHPDPSIGHKLQDIAPFEGPDERHLDVG